MNFTKILRETSNRRVSKAQRRTLEENDILGCQSEDFAINMLLDQALATSGGTLVEENLISLLREFTSNDISGVLREKIRRLQERLDAGEDSHQIRMLLKIILRSKEKLLEKQQGSQPGTPASSDDEDEEDYHVYAEDESFNNHTEEHEDSPDNVWFNNDNEEHQDDHGDKSSDACLIRQSYSDLTSTPPTSDCEADEEVLPVALINKATEHHPNSHFTFEQNRQSHIFSLNKSKIIKVERNMPDVTMTHKPFKKIRKAIQVTVPDDKAVQTTLKKQKKIKKNKDEKVVDPWLQEGLSLDNKREPALPAANISKTNTNSTAEVYNQRLQRCLIPNTTKPFKQQATCENDFKSSSILYYDASNLDISKPLVSWPVPHDSSDTPSTVVTEHDHKLEQSCKSFKGHTSQNGAINVSEQVKPRLNNIQDNHQTEDCSNNFSIPTIPDQRLTRRIGLSFYFFLNLYSLVKLPIFINRHGYF